MNKKAHEEVKLDADDLAFLDSFIANEEGIKVFAEAMAAKLGGEASQYAPYLASCGLNVAAVLVHDTVNGLKRSLMLPEQARLLWR